MPLPAHHTKHLNSLAYPIGLDLTVNLLQVDDGKTNGTGLWLGAQCLSLFLANSHKRPSPSIGRPKAVELGSGVGLTALTLAALGWDVLATDVSNVITTVLSQNIARNTAVLPAGSGCIEIRELDWTVTPEKWSWDNDRVIASASCENPQGASDLQLSSLQVESSLQRPGPPFDLIVTSDTIYSPELARPLLRTLYALYSASRTPHTRCPPIYLCIERRDPTLIDRTLAEAKDVWGFTVVRIPHRKVVKAMDKGGVKWDQEEWEGIEIWKLTSAADVTST
ncbi:hypothetical protein PILCRDRAFT_822017 [Piloderma croceum F 1598]|uniref:Uncharacterized protein n=1 Tax=Piloderma croceum (strain F 1598) TaxID=765440 RepID=A0A0C3FND4_PILCF|nr:hypothetical protein PILCRDRAFT_822017 [Piloderma croceum F 1598]